MCVCVSQATEATTEDFYIFKNRRVCLEEKSLLTSLLSRFWVCPGNLTLLLTPTHTHTHLQWCIQAEGGVAEPRHSCVPRGEGREISLSAWLSEQNQAEMNCVCLPQRARHTEARAWRETGGGREREREGERGGGRERGGGGERGGGREKEGGGERVREGEGDQERENE